MSNPNGMNGQWIGKWEGSSRGPIMVNIDERELHYAGAAYLLDENPALPGTAAFFSTPNKDNPQQFRADLLAIDRDSGDFFSWDKVKSKFPADVTFPKSAEVTGTWNIDSLKFSWVTDIGTQGTCELPRSKADKPSEIVSQKLSWSDYKTHVSNLLSKGHLFRGQNGSWRLRTSFHRSGRADLHRYLTEDVPALHRQLSARTKHVFNLKDPDENGAFYNLVQHHGYPTPLLDWTYSPYVAAFFAYREISNEKAASAPKDETVRVLVFDQSLWRTDLNQILLLIRSFPYVSVGEFIAIENERMIPQQAASTITNVDDIETYIRSYETATKKYLWAIDLPVRERRDVVRELSYMGITAGSLFPGLDGACEELKERNFEI